MIHTYLEKLQNSLINSKKIEIKELAEITLNRDKNLFNFKIEDINYLNGHNFKSEEIKNDFIYYVNFTQIKKNSHLNDDINELVPFGIPQVKIFNSFYILKYSKEFLYNKYNLIRVLNKHKELNVIVNLWMIGLFTKEELNDYFIIEYKVPNYIKMKSYTITDYRTDTNNIHSNKGYDVLFYTISVDLENYWFEEDNESEIKKISSKGIFDINCKSQNNRSTININKSKNIFIYDLIRWNSKRIDLILDCMNNPPIGEKLNIIFISKIREEIIDIYNLTMNHFYLMEDEIMNLILIQIFKNHDFNLGYYMSFYKKHFNLIKNNIGLSFSGENLNENYDDEITKMVFSKENDEYYSLNYLKILFHHINKQKEKIVNRNIEILLHTFLKENMVKSLNYLTKNLHKIGIDLFI